MTSKKSILFALVLFNLNNLNVDAQKLEYPTTKKTEVFDEYFGTKISDPYRWLEDDNSAETADWVVQQNKVTNDFLATIPFRDSLKSRMTQLWNFPKYLPPFKCGQTYFYIKNNGLDNQGSLWYQRSLLHVATLFLDPAKVDKTGNTFLSDYTPSRNGEYLAFKVAKAGSDWQQIRVKEVRTAKTLADSIDWAKFSNIAWQGYGFYYSRYDAVTTGKYSGKNENHKVYYHALGTTQDKDILVYHDDEHPLRTYSATTTEDEKYLLLSISESTSGNAMMIKNLYKNETSFTPLFEGFSDNYNLINNEGDKLYFLTTNNAPKGRIIVVNAANPADKNWQDIVPQQDDVMQSAKFAGGKLIVKYMHNASNILKVYDLNGKFENDIKQGTYTTIDAMEGNKEDSVFFYSAVSLTSPPAIYKYLIDTKKTLLHFQPKLKYNPDDFVTKQVFYNSKDGTSIPMFIVHKKNVVLDGKNPLLLFGYGGFNISKTPEFKPERITFLEQGGIFAMPNIRGGGEFGEAWHKAGTILKKQNVFDDFIAAAEYLIKNKYTNKDKLAISGRSNGGLLIGACMTQRPDLFRVAIPVVGVMDMLRYNKFTIGWSWKSDYGTSENQNEFDALIKYSPLHNIKPGKIYPATLVTTGDHDDRVVPAHSFKFISTLQEAQKGDLPTLIRIDTNAGHGAGKPTSKLIDEQTDVFAFMMFFLGMKY
ncbi:MAG TPA: prolyl oligopeptidase family serine peptidase [Bacteroidia bacterium]|nr:prolyl oligopeptidase family serine peptidase [Bacteroidia bacterium]